MDVPLTQDVQKAGDTVESTIAQRAGVHGDYSAMAETYSRLRAATGSESLGLSEHDHALAMICTKLARIVCGDPNHADHWHDIAGYATLAEKACTKVDKAG